MHTKLSSKFCIMIILSFVLTSDLKAGTKNRVSQTASKLSELETEINTAIKMEPSSTTHCREDTVSNSSSYEEKSSSQESSDFDEPFPKEKLTQIGKKLINDPYNALPVAQIHAKGRTFYFSDPFLIQHDGRSYEEVVMFTMSKNGKMLVPRVLYRSQSDGTWRVASETLPLRDGQEVRYAFGKGTEQHYTQETKPILEISAYLDSIKGPAKELNKSDSRRFESYFSRPIIKMVEGQDSLLSFGNKVDKIQAHFETDSQRERAKQFLTDPESNNWGSPQWVITTLVKGNSTSF